MNRNQNFSCWKLWSLEAFTSLCQWKETFFWYMEIKAVWEMHTQPEDFWDSQDLCIICHCLYPSCYQCQLLQFFCLWVFFSNTGCVCIIAALSFYQPSKLFSFRVFHLGMKEDYLLICVIHPRSSYVTLLMILWSNWKVCTSEPKRYTDRMSKP